MDWLKTWRENRIFIAAVALALSVGLAIWSVQSHTGDSPTRAGDRSEGFPELARDDIQVLEITRPDEGSTTVRLVRGEDGTWRIAAPIDALADQSAVSTALDKLAELDVASIAAHSAQFHERLEVDSAHGVHVVARGAEDRVLADLWIGAYRSSNTMVRVEGHDEVVGVRGSIKFAFNKELREWRDRAILDVDPETVREVAWVGPNGSFRFVRPVMAAEPAAEGEEHEAGEGATPATHLGDWQIAEVSYTPPVADGGVPGAALTTIENFAPTKVRSMVASLARMRASDFAEASTTPTAAGFGDAAARVTLATGEGEEAQTFVVRVGAESNAERHDYYAMHDGDQTIYVISRFLGERLSPHADAFAQTPAAPGAAPEAPPPGEGAPGGAPPDLPPEIMEQIQRQLQQQGLAGGHP